MKYRSFTFGQMRRWPKTADAMGRWFKDGDDHFQISTADLSSLEEQPRYAGAKFSLSPDEEKGKDYAAFKTADGTDVPAGQFLSNKWRFDDGKESLTAFAAGLSATKTIMEDLGGIEGAKALIAQRKELMELDMD
jgi:hypothetical protein